LRVTQKISHKSNSNRRAKTAARQKKTAGLARAGARAKFQRTREKSKRAKIFTVRTVALFRAGELPHPLPRAL
jgi:hypothetical protein